MDLKSFLDRIVLDWPLLSWAKAVGLAAVIAVVLVGARRLASHWFGRVADRTKNHVDDVVVAIIRGSRSFFLAAAALVVAKTVLEAPDAADQVIWRLFFLALLVQVGLWGNDLVSAASRWYISREEHDGEADPSRVTAARAFALMGRLVLWSILLILTLDNFGVDITALVAGLGIGGIAIALAVQNVLKDILAYVSILVDQPFVIGDFLMVGDLSGTVEHVGVKSTRMRSLSGEQLVFSNEDLLSSRIRNYKRMFERRVVFSVGVVYGTPPGQLEAIPGLMKEAIEAQADVRFDRAHFKAMADFALTFEGVYYVLVPDYAAYMDRQQAINLQLYRKFGELGLEFAFPTQTLHVESLPAAD